LRCNPNASERIGIDAILHELTSAFLVNINATSLTVMDITADDCWVRKVLHFNPRDPIAMNVALLKISIPVLKREHTNISSMMDVALAEGRMGMVFDPNARQIVPSNLTILKRPLSMIT
jgi:hypothetical protein